MKHYVVVHDYGYEGYSEPMGVYTSLRKLQREYPEAVPYEDSVVSAAKRGKLFEGKVYFTFERGNDNKFEKTQPDQ